MSDICDLLENLVTEIKSQCSVDSFLSGDQEKVLSGRLNRTKDLYDLGRSMHPAASRCSALPSLMVDGFDAEQVWQQIEVGCNCDLDSWSHRVEVMVKQSNTLVLATNGPRKPMKNTESGNKKSKEKKGIKESNSSNSLGYDVESEDDLTRSNDENDDDNIDIQGLIGNKKRKRVDTADDKNADIESDEDDENLRKALDNIQSSSEDEAPSKRKLHLDKRSEPKAKKKSYEVDDQFFKLADMESFLEAQERKEGKPEQSGSEEDEEEEDEDNISDDDSENEPMAKDFFDNPDNENVGDDERDNDEEEEEDSSDEEEKDFWKQTSMTKEEKSSFEKRLEKIKAKVNELEEENLNEKPWQMKGEVLASARPQNSLLSELVDFEHVARQPPMITEEVTQTEESFIIQRIKDRAWDDVQRKIKPADLGQEYRKKIVLNQEKSQLGLADVYAAEYQKETERLTASGETVEKESGNHKEIRQSLERLFVKLDALSNFHFTPKPVMRDIEIITNEPSISVENVAPTFFSEAATLAPEEVQGKTKGQLLGDGEKTSTDKRRERRRKKRRQQIKKIAKEEKEKLKSALGVGGTSKVQAMGEVVKKSKMDKGITIVKGTRANEQNKMKNSNKSLSSTKFFNQLQQDVVDTIKQKTVQKPKETNSLSAKRIKL